MNSYNDTCSFGFTLLEVMIAISILAFALVTIFGAVNRNLDLSGKAENRAIAADLAGDIMSRIEVEGLPEVREDSGEFEKHPDFGWNLSILPYNLQGLGAEVSIVKVLITWDGGKESYELNLAVEGR